MRRRPAAALLALALALGCARRAALPTPESPQTRAPDLTGRTVMVLPAQPVGSIASTTVQAFDAEAAYWLGDRGARVRWKFPRQLEQSLTTAGGLDIDLHNLAVGDFRGMRLRRIGDPLFGDLRRLGALVDARYALLPTSLAYVPPPAGQTQGRVEVAAALVDTMGGDVVWFGVLAGERGPEDDRATAATAARALARAVVP
ncbi:MAG TPA: hypothetical protein VFQ38_12065 [Longimicrobiales bacterium]|nr:hypothetical protein [Longimicrobiales bacterium]